ncbi:MAG: L-2-amino-thiazoline-4-carboxylic acid hydrolase [Lachnospiraceae bacterium]|nr:L-2-amino-thiazoline-4-carboxylic acid hydrolase [Lachnospiraceae bacterium]
MSEKEISKCMYVEIFKYYGIRPLCKLFCNTDRIAYSGLTRHVNFVRHSDLSDGDVCFDEIFRK